MLRVLTLSSLYPDATRPNFGVFVERQTRSLAARDDVELRVVAPIGIPPWPLSRHPRYRALAALPLHEEWNGVDVHRPRFAVLPGTGGRLHARALTAALRPLLARIRRDFAFDVIDAEFFFPDGPAAIPLGDRFGVPVSIKARGADIHHWGAARGTQRQVRDAGNAAAGLLAVSEALARDIAALGIDTPVLIHRTGIDRAAFTPRDRIAAKAALGVSGPLIASVGALIPRKGHDIVIDAIASLPGVSLHIAGDGPDREALAGRIAAHGAGDRIRLLGPVPHAELPALFAAADGMALASSSEGLANAWVEALASGTPVVIPDAGGARELVAGPAAGRIVARDAAAFAQAIAQILADPPAQADVAATVADYSWERNRDALFDHLSKLVANHRQSSG